MPENATLRDYYADLCVSSNATNSEIRSAFHKLARQHHPDKKVSSKDDDSSEFRRVREAYENLVDEERRAAYDALRAERIIGNRNTYAYTFMGSSSGNHSSPNSSSQNPPPSAFGGPHYRSNSTPQSSPNLTAHGTRVLMTNHPATSQLDCFYKTEYWQAQSGTEYCIFCILPWKGCHRCPGCEAVACIGCFKAIAKRESGGGRARPASFHYTPSGG